MKATKIVMNGRWMIAGFFAGITFTVACLWRVFPEWKMVIAAGIVLTAYCVVIAARKPQGLADWEIKSGQYTIPGKKYETGARGRMVETLGNHPSLGYRMFHPELDAPATKRKCPKCGRLILVRKDGNLRVHKPCLA